MNLSMYSSMASEDFLAAAQAAGSMSISTMGLSSMDIFGKGLSHFLELYIEDKFLLNVFRSSPGCS